MRATGTASLPLGAVLGASATGLCGVRSEATATMSSAICVSAVSRVGTRCAWQSSRPRHHWKQRCCRTLRSRPPCERIKPLQIDYRALAELCRSSCVATTGHPHSFYPVIFVPPSSCPRVVEQAFGVGALAFAISIQLYGTYTPIRLPHLLPAAGGFPWGKAVVPRGFPH